MDRALGLTLGIKGDRSLLKEHRVILGTKRGGAKAAGSEVQEACDALILLRRGFNEGA